ncbi:MAG: hypothetical protein NTX15_09495 [Candidatus Kapabacteria bacterium]|nr:hypothetical protein [Candidatus Kapabacteria bacterium]
MDILIIGRHERIVNGAKRIALAFGHQADVALDIDEQRSLLAGNTYHLILVHCGVSSADRGEISGETRMQDFVLVDGLISFFEAF